MPWSAAERYGHKNENDDKVLVIGDNLIFQDSYPLPVVGASVTSGYGERAVPFTGSTAFHSGTDFGGAWQSNIYSVADGEVVKVNTAKNDGYGNYIIIKHTAQRTNDVGGIETEVFYGLYAHMNEIYIVGKTGRGNRLDGRRSEP